MRIETAKRFRSRHGLFGQLAFGLTLLTQPSFLVFSQTTVVLNDSVRSYFIGHHLEILADPDAKWTIAEVTSDSLARRFVPNPLTPEGLDKKVRVFWARFRLKSNLTTAQEWFLQPTQPHQWEKVELYIPQPSGEFALKKIEWTFMSNDGEANRVRGPGSFFTPCREKTTYYLRLERKRQVYKSTIVLAPVLYNKEAYLQPVQSKRDLAAIFIGLFLVLVFYTAYRWVGNRSKRIVPGQTRLAKQTNDEENIKPLAKAKDHNMDAVFLQRVTAAVERHLDDETFNVESMALEISMSRTQLYRKLRALTGQSASQFICAVRLQHAIQMLQQRVGTVAEIAYAVGFGSPAYFTKCFRKHFGVPPSALTELKSRGPALHQ